MKFTYLFAAVSSLLCASNASPLLKRQATTCLTYSGTSVYFTEIAATSCPTVTAPAAVDLPVVTPTTQLEVCFYQTDIPYAELAQTSLMLSMSSLATEIYNAQTSGAVLCSRTKTANLPPPITTISSATVEPASEITVIASA